MASRIDFYLLQEEKEDSCLSFVCRLIEKAFRQGHRIYIQAGSEQEAHKLDNLLWTYKEESFIPHNLQGEGPNPAPPIQIGFSDSVNGFNDVLINLGEAIPNFYNRFKRVIEIIPNQEQSKEGARTRFKLYKKDGCEVNTHKI